MSTQINCQAFKTNSIKLNVYTAGPEGGELVVLLHGFPQHGYVWEHQIRALAEQGYRVLSPDQRGYGNSNKPSKVSDYKPDILVDDVLGLIEAVDRDSAYIIGHGYGAVLAWIFADKYPSQTNGIIAINAPSPDASLEYIKKHPSQIIKSWYMFLLGIPLFPDWLLSRNNYSLLKKIILASSKSGTFTDEYLNQLAISWNNDRSISRMIDWYRAAFRYPYKSKHPKTPGKVSMIWGNKDQFSPIEAAKLSSQFCHQPLIIHYLEDIGHWAMNEAPGATTRLIISDLKEFSRK